MAIHIETKVVDTGVNYTDNVNCARLEVTVKIDGMTVGKYVALSGRKVEVVAYYEGRMTLAEVMKQWGF